MKRRLLDRVHDRAWRVVGECLSGRPQPSAALKSGGVASSISSELPWADVCGSFANGGLASDGFRRCSAVRDIVETVGPVDGRFYAGRIRDWGPEWLTNPVIARIDTWGGPIRWPGWLLGTPRAFSPTTLRYLATALWLKRNGYLSEGSEVIEIGVGFGGLAAMNAAISGAVTTVVDLPQVEMSALRMLNETGLGRHGRLSGEWNGSSVPLVISNYAVTELNATIQEHYFETYLKHAAHGIIISNSGVFASTIGGRTDDELIARFRAGGLDAGMETANDLLGPCDYLCGVGMIRW